MDHHCGGLLFYSGAPAGCYDMEILSYRLLLMAWKGFSVVCCYLVSG